jgi:hypothetical protein
VSCKSLRVSSEGLGGQAGPDIAARGPEVLVLPDGPYRFGPDDGPEVFPGQRVSLVDGRHLTWYGP